MTNTLTPATKGKYQRQLNINSFWNERVKECRNEGVGEGEIHSERDIHSEREIQSERECESQRMLMRVRKWMRDVREGCFFAIGFPPSTLNEK